MPVLDPKLLCENRVQAIQRYHEHTGIFRAELDVSGGVDSAVMLILLAKALGPNRVTAVYSRINSSSKSSIHAQMAADVAGVKLCQVHATGAYNVLVDSCMQALSNAGYCMEEIQTRMEEDPTIMGSLRSTYRAPMGRFMNRVTGGGIRHGTGNECEDRWLRFYQKGGDGEVDTNPLAMLSKGEVYQLAVEVGVPKSIINAVPSPDLWGVSDDHNDEDELYRLSGVDWTYSRVDAKTGEYTSVGTIESMSRFLDSYECHFYDSRRPNNGFISRYSWDAQNGDLKLTSVELNHAKKFGLTEHHLRSALKWEFSTRHKENPNIPTLQNRLALLDEGILTDDLPSF